MDSKSLKVFKDKLERERESAIRTVKQMDDNEFNESQAEYTKELSVYDNHPADIGSETYEMEKNLALKKQNMHRIQQIEQALDRLEKGEYGICALCGQEISHERLEAHPESDICLDCSRGTRLPGERIREGRPVEEKSLNFPYNREPGTENDRIIFDGEDSWQAVARYNRREDDPSNQTGDEQGLWDEIPSGLVEDIDRISNRYFKNTLDEEYEE
jgi:YteA family regulatory protein